MMPMDKSRYPDDWDAISYRIRFERAGGKCEQCGAVHGSTILRSLVDPAKFVVMDDDGGYMWPDGSPIDHLPEEYNMNLKTSRVILTTHHVGVDKPDGTPGDPHDKMDCRDENLLSLCQRCHFIEDLPIHIENAKRTRAAKREQALKDAGQERLL